MLERQNNNDAIMEKDEKRYTIVNVIKCRRLQLYRTHLQDGLPLPGEDGNAPNVRGHPTLKQTDKKTVRRHHRLVQLFTTRGCSTDE